MFGRKKKVPDSKVDLMLEQTASLIETVDIFTDYMEAVQHNLRSLDEDFTDLACELEQLKADLPTRRTKPARTLKID